MWPLASRPSCIGGATGDKAVAADYDGDGKSDVAVFRPATCDWWIISSKTKSILQTTWGAPGDLPAPADYDGDGKTDPAVFRPSEGKWYILGSSWGMTARQFGVSGDVPVPGAFTNEAGDAGDYR